jgi:hypothetical protein
VTASLLRREHPVIGGLTPYMPGAWFERFDTETIHGLALVRGRRIDFLAVDAYAPGRGDFGRFLGRCMDAYDTIGVWEIINSELEAMLTRRGFIAAREPFQGEMSDGLRWDAAPNAACQPSIPRAPR